MLLVSQAQRRAPRRTRGYARMRNTAVPYGRAAHSRRGPGSLGPVHLVTLRDGPQKRRVGAHGQTLTAVST